MFSGGLCLVVDGDADNFGECGETGGGFSHAVLTQGAHADFHGAAADDGRVRHLVDETFDGCIQNEDLIDSETAFVAFVAFGAASALHEGAVFDITGQVFPQLLVIPDMEKLRAIGIDVYSQPWFLILLQM